MGNEVEKMGDSTDQINDDIDSTGAVGPGPLPSTLSASDSGDQSVNQTSTLPAPPSPSQLRSTRRRQNRGVCTNPLTDVDSTAAVGPCFTMNTSGSKDETSTGGVEFTSSDAVFHQASSSSFRPSSPPNFQSIAFLSPSSPNTSGSTGRERDRKGFRNSTDRYTGNGSSLLATSSPHRQRVSSPLRKNSKSSIGGAATGAGVGGREADLPLPVAVGPELEIEDGTPAAEALKANAKVKVTKMGKAARFMNAQAIKRLINQSKLWNRRRTGNKRGKPPRVPEIARRWSDNDVLVDTVKAELKQIVEDEEQEDDDGDVSKFSMKKSKSSISGIIGKSGSTGHVLDSKELSSRDFREIPKKGDEEEPDATYVGYNVEQPPTITLHDRYGKKQEIKMFGRMKQRRKERRESRTYVKGRVIQEEHELYTLSIAVMLGLRYAIYQTHRQLEQDKQEKRFWLDSEEFMRMEKYVFRPDGRHNTPPHKLGHTFKFKDYSPVPFAYIRRMFGINEYEFIHSVCGNANFIEFISNAKSGQFFFYSSDGKYMIKTMTNTESKFLRRILPHYFRHCAQNPSTLMAKFLGMYRVKLYHLQRNVKFIVMNSVFDTDKMISSFYDLKGSRLGRQAKPGESVKKDNDVRKLLRNDPNGGFVLPPAVRERLKEQVIKDCDFLKEMKIMDYSMLIGVHYIPSKSAGSGDSIRGLVFRDSESVRPNSRKKKEQKKVPQMVKKPQKIERARSDSGSPFMKSFFDRTLLTAPMQFNKSSVQVEMKRMPSGKKVDFLLDEEVLGNELLEEKPLDKMQRSNLSFNLNEIDEKISLDQQSMLSDSTLGFDEDEMGHVEFQQPSDEIVNSPVSESSHLDWRKERLEVDIRREVAIEQSYWPFHRYYEINGQRRVIPINNIYRSNIGEDDPNSLQNTNCAASCLGDPKNFDPDLTAARAKWQLKDYEKPISNRKDNGYTMDTTGIELPMDVTLGKQGKEKLDCDGKIFYMGIIDILQQFNIRKRMEARFRRLKGGGWDGASCVHPNFYAERFVNFFDEYTRRGGFRPPTESHAHDEEILFMNQSN